MTLIIRPVAPRDFAAWLPLWQGYNAFYGRAGKMALAPAITEMTWSRFLDPDEPVHALVAEVDDRLLGLTHFLFHRSTTLIGTACYLQDLFTLPEARGKGVGRALIEGVCAAARAAGAGRVYWHTHTANAPGRLLYDKMAKHAGFIVYAKTF